MAWYHQFPAAVTLCDPDGIILEMNEKAAVLFASDGGMALIGRNLFDCHPEPARIKMSRLMDNRQTNAYTIEKNGIHKFIYQAPWYKDGKYAGFVEISMEIPAVLPHFVRPPK
jgi:PAS domain-containing protein